MKAPAIELKRDLGLWSAVALVVGTIIGSGIFLVPRAMAQRVGTTGMVFTVWIIGGLLSLFGALSFAELAAALPEAGGAYVYLREAYGPLWGFLNGWTSVWVAKSGSVATLATAFFVYFANFVPEAEHVLVAVPLPIGPGGGPLEIRYGQLMAMALILLLGLLNYFGVKVGGNVQVVVTVVKISLIFFVIIAGIFFGHAAAPAPSAAIELTSAGFFAAMVAALWAYDGWDNVSMVASEIKNPQRNLPLALIGGTVCVIAIYLLANLAYFHVLSVAEVARPGSRVAADMMRKVLGNRGAGAVSIAAMISIFAALNGSILTGARVPYAMARDRRFFQPVAHVHPRFHTPGTAILGLSAWSALLVLSGWYEQLFTFVIFASWLFYGMATAAVLILRWKRPELPRPYRALGYPFVPALFVLAAFCLVISTFRDSPRESLMGLFLIFLGLPFYFFWKNRPS